MQNAVDPGADAQAVLVRLDADVAGALVRRLDRGFTDELDDGRVLSQLRQLAVVRLQLFQQLNGFAAFLHHRGDGFATDAEVRLDQSADLARAGEDRLNVHAGQRVQLV